MGHAYGNFIFREDDSLAFYGYNAEDEYNLTMLISEDKGKTWDMPFKSHVAKIARNPQVGFVNGNYILHGRSGQVKWRYYVCKICRTVGAAGIVLKNMSSKNRSSSQ